MAVDHKPDDGPYFVPSLSAGCAGVHMQALQFIVVDDLKDVRMSADE
jgi:hypothetical protein